MGGTRAPVRFQMVPLRVHVHVIRLSVVRLSVCCATNSLLHKIPSTVCVFGGTHGCDLVSKVRRDQSANSYFVRPSG